jgi:putative DNA-invertase from lambdoid prophage Rac
MPIVYAYGRASTGRQTITESHQRATCEEHIQRAILPAGFTYGGWLYDSATSGSKPMFERDEGRKLWALVQPGDKIVWAKLDRAFRSVVDGARTMHLLHHKGVTFNSLDLGLDTCTPIGRCICTILISFAELELEFVKQRTRDALRSKMAQGLPYGRCTPIGWRRIGKRHTAYFQPDLRERAQVEQIASMRTRGLSLDDIVQELRGVVRPRGRHWDRKSVSTALRAKAAGYPKTYLGERRSPPSHLGAVR